jgi:hypothetical protein
MNPSFAIFDALHPGRQDEACPHRTADLPSSATPEAFPEWRPSCFGRLALEYATRFQLAVLPLLVDGAAPVFRAVPRGAADASRDPDVIRAWWTRAPRANVGIACRASGLVVLEVDLRGGGPETLALRARRLGPLPTTWTARTLDGWTQMFFSHADPDVAALPRLRPIGPGVRATHSASVVAPPSVCHGQHCAWRFDRRPDRTPLAAMPKTWLDRLTGRALPRQGMLPKKVIRAAHDVLRDVDRPGFIEVDEDLGFFVERGPLPKRARSRSRGVLSALGLDLAEDA